MILLLAVVLPALAAGDAVPEGAVKLPPPRVEYHANEASATTSPWIDANGWQILRAPDKHYYYNVPATEAALAAAEAFVYGAQATVHTDSAGAASFERMVAFLHTIPAADLPPIANIGIIDDGSDETGEVMNLLTRHNLLYKIEKTPDPRLAINVRLGSKEYPKEQAEDPDVFARKLRGDLGDEHRSLRIYGSEVVVARFEGSEAHARVHLLDYARRRVPGLRVRVLGTYRHQTLRAFSKPDAKLQDVVVADGATEFTVPEIDVYAVIDLTK